MVFAARLPLMAFIALSLANASVQEKAPTLKPGQKAPPIKVAEWIKGAPVARFERGKFYVVEFWATWCGPCIEAMPHLSKLSRQYRGKVEFVGISVWERGANVPKLVREFVRKQGDRMTYRVARDRSNGTMAQTWLVASGQKGIPASFLLNDQGTILWIGHPTELDPILVRATTGKFDVATSLKAFERGQRVNDLETECENGATKVFALLKAGRDADALELIDRLDARVKKETPEDHFYPARFKSLRFAVRHRKDPSAVEAEVEKMLGTKEGNFIALDLLEYASQPGGDRAYGLRLLAKMRKTTTSWVNWMNLGWRGEALRDNPSAILADYETAKKVLAESPGLDQAMREKFEKDIDNGIARVKKQIGQR